VRNEAGDMKDPLSIFKSYFPEGTLNRILVIIVIGVIANLLLFFINGAYHDRDKIVDVETPEFTIVNTEQAVPNDPSGEYVLIFHENDQRTKHNELRHDPIPNGTTGDVTFTAIISRERGRIISVELLYKTDNCTQTSLEMDNSFRESYSETEWNTVLNVPEGHNISYLFEITYTPRYTDVYRFYDRCETVVEGEVLYRDSGYRTETAPLITYVMIPGYYLSKWTDPSIGFAAYFMAFAVISSVALYLMFRRWGDDRAFLMGAMLAFYPSMLNGALKAQDEPLMAIFFIVPLFLMLSRKMGASAVSMGAGIGVKMWPGLLFPGLLSMYLKDWRKDVKSIIRLIAFFVVPVALVFLLFYALAGDEFTFFLKGYLGLTFIPSSSATIWNHFLNDVGWYDKLKPVLLGVIIVSTLWVLHRSTKVEIHPLRVTMFVIAIFFIFYLKLHPGYFIFFLIVLLPAMSEDLKLSAEVFVLPLLFMMGTHYYSTMLQSILVVISWIILFDVLRQVLINPYSFDSDLGDGAEKHSYGPILKK